ENKVEPRAIEVERIMGDKVVVSKGLKAGESIIVEGSQKAPPGSMVKAVPFAPSPASDLETRSKPNCGSTMAQFFINRPIFAWVVSILIMVLGSLAITQLPVAQYPSVAPPSISVTANYAGASAETLQETVTSVIEQQLNGIDNLL